MKQKRNPWCQIMLLVMGYHKDIEYHHDSRIFYRGSNIPNPSKKKQALLRGSKRLTCTAVFNDAVLVFWVLRPCFPATFQSSSPLYTSGQQQVASVLSQSLGELGHGQVSSLCKTKTPNFYWVKSP